MLTIRLTLEQARLACQVLLRIDRLGSREKTKRLEKLVVCGQVELAVGHHRQLIQLFRWKVPLTSVSGPNHQSAGQFVQLKLVQVTVAWLVRRQTNVPAPLHRDLKSD